MKKIVSILAALSMAAALLVSCSNGSTTPKSDPVEVAAVTIWEGSVVLPDGWDGNSAYTIPADKFADIAVGGTIGVDFTGQAAQVKSGAWSALPGLASQVDSYGNMYAAFTFVLTADDVTALQASGMLLFGNDCTFTKVTYKAAN